MVPIGERAVAWLERYLNDTRPSLVVPPDDATFFLTASGEQLSPNRLTQLVREYVDAAEIGKRGACHLFRHTMATLMLENGADIRYRQEMLGHAELSTTRIYTRVSSCVRSLHAGNPTAMLSPPYARTATPAFLCTLPGQSIKLTSSRLISHSPPPSLATKIESRIPPRCLLQSCPHGCARWSTSWNIPS
jgi:integrase/recombinase XerD